MAAGLPGAVEQTLFGAPQQGNGLEKVSPSSEPIKASRVVSTNANPLPPTPPTQRELAALHLETQAALVRAHQVQSAKYQLQEQLMTLYSRQRSVLSKFARETHVPELALDCFGDDSKRQASLLAETMAQVEGLVTEQRRMQEQLERRQSLVNSNPPLSADVVMKQLMDGPLYTFKQEYSANVRQTDQRLEECVLLIGNLRQEITALRKEVSTLRDSGHGSTPNDGAMMMGSERTNSNEWQLLAAAKEAAADSKSEVTNATDTKPTRVETEGSLQSGSGPISAPSQGKDASPGPNESQQLSATHAAGIATLQLLSQANAQPGTFQRRLPRAASECLRLTHLSPQSESSRSLAPPTPLSTPLARSKLNGSRRGETTRQKARGGASRSPDEDRARQYDIDSHWREMLDDKSETFYYNSVTSVKQWVKPTTSTLFWDEVETEDGTLFYHCKSTKQKSWELPTNGIVIRKGSPDDPTTWEKYISDSGKPFYRSKVMNKKQWEIPPCLLAVAPTDPSKLPVVKKTFFGTDWIELEHDGRSFYLNKTTKQKVWNRPSELEYVFDEG